MIRRITLHNFMSHCHTVIEPAEGLTVLVGENNCGKSAVVAALQILCNNVRGDYMVRHGENDCWIMVETEEGNTIEWRRENGTVSYRLNGEPLYRLSGDVPEDLHRLLRLPQVIPQDGGPAFDIHFGEQKKPVFLLDEPGSRAAKFFASSSDAETLIRMQQLYTRKVREATNRSRHLQDQIGRLDRQLQPLGQVESVQSRLDLLETAYGELLALGPRVAALNQDVESLRKRIGEVDLLERRTGTLAGLGAPPRLKDTVSLSKLSDGLSSSLSQVSLLQQKTRALTVLRTPPILKDAAPLSGLAEKLSSSLLEIAELHQLTTALAVLAGPPALRDTTTLTSLCEELSAATEDHERSELRSETLDRLNAPPRLADAQVLEKLVDAFTDTTLAADHLSATHAALSGLTTTPVLAPTESLETTCDQMSSWTARSEYHGARARCTVRLQVPPAPFDAQSLLHGIDGIEYASIEVQRCRDASDTLERCAAPPVLRDEESLANCVGELIQRSGDVASRLLACGSLAALSSPPSLVDLSPLTTLIAEIEAAQQDQALLEDQLNKSKDAAWEAEMAIRNWVAETRVCPTCGAKLDPEHMIAMAASATREHLHG